MMEHVVNCDGLRGFVAELDHPQRVPDEQDIDASAADMDRRGVVVGSHHRNLSLALATDLDYIRHAYLLLSGSWRQWCSLVWFC